ncbi:hypothetical protein TWF696_008412 [Orbilia brochopaga]|uniref:Uncharacterized protein n=1 Tax=Orbilia brochopaga TaxID=3140254 RepID=A0AAV9UFM6_9PEZI
MAAKKSVPPSPELPASRFRTRSERARSVTVPPETAPASPVESEVESEVESGSEATDTRSKKSIASKRSAASKKSTTSKKPTTSKKSKASNKNSQKPAAANKDSKKSTAPRTASKRGRDFDDEANAVRATPAKRGKIEGVFSRAKILAKDGLKYPPDFSVASKKPQRRMVTNHLTPTDQARALRKTGKAPGTSAAKDIKEEDDVIQVGSDRVSFQTESDDVSIKIESDDDNGLPPIDENGRRHRRTEAELLVIYAKTLPAIGKLRYKSKVTRSGKSFGSS